MRIGIDGIALTIKFPCGTREYAQQLLFALAKIDKKNEYIIFASEDVVLPKQKNFLFKKINIPFPYLKRQLFFPLAVRKENIDIFHYLHPYGAALFSHPRIITTILDIRLNEIFRSIYDPKYIFQYVYTALTRRGVFSQTNTFISISENTRKEFKEKFKIRKPIVTIPLGINECFRLKYDLKSIKKERYILAFADYSPRKNISNVITAYSLLPTSIKENFRLIIIISTDYPIRKIQYLINKNAVSRHVDVIKNISVKELSYLYRKAQMLVSPSLYEGFGLPILEAMASGCPVITSNYGAMKEVAGDAAYLVDPKNATKISYAMKHILEDSKLSSSLVLKGLIHSKQFSWKKAARETLQVYEQIYQS